MTRIKAWREKSLTQKLVRFWLFLSPFICSKIALGVISGWAVLVFWFSDDVGAMAQISELLPTSAAFDQWLFAMLSYFSHRHWSIVLLVYYYFCWRYQQKVYLVNHKGDIDAHRIPPSLGEYLIDLIYQYKYGWPLLLIMLFTLVIIWLAEWPEVQAFLDRLLGDSKAKGTFILAIASAPTIVYAWFIRAYERSKTLQKEESSLWSLEFHDTIKQALTSDNSLALRQVAIRQLQPFLSGAKWRANQGSNSAVILQTFSSIVDEVTQIIPVYEKEKEQEP